MTRTKDWYCKKALACVTAYQHRYNQNPTKHAICLVCAVSLHETACGDLLGPGNWGAVQRRRMTLEERALVAIGKTPQPKDSFEVLHGDSSPITGKYQTWFWAFPDGIVYPPADLEGDAAGAWMLLGVLLDERPHIKEGIDYMYPESLASLMYNDGKPGAYFEGFHDPRKSYYLLSGKWIPEDKLGPSIVTPTTPKKTGKELNVDSYAGAIRSGVYEFIANVGDWGFRSPPVAP